jgi:hypothetical protein
MLEYEKRTFFSKILPALNHKLIESKKEYFGGVLSIADLIYYHEISTILLLSTREISKTELPRLHEWYYENMRQKNV